VAHNEDCFALLLKLNHSLVALFPERRIANREHFVDEEDVHLSVHCHGESKPSKHTRRIMLHLSVNEMADLRELENISKSCVCFVLCHAENGRVEIDVFPTSEIWVESGTDLQ